MRFFASASLPVCCCSVLLAASRSGGAEAASSASTAASTSSAAASSDAFVPNAASSGVVSPNVRVTFRRVGGEDDVPSPVGGGIGDGGGARSGAGRPTETRRVREAPRREQRALDLSSVAAAEDDNGNGNDNDNAYWERFLQEVGSVPTGAQTPPPTTGSPTTSGPTASPTSTPTASPTSIPTASPTSAGPTSGPTDLPTGAPTGAPTDVPTGVPTSGPTTGTPTSTPTFSPTDGCDVDVTVECAVDRGLTFDNSTDCGRIVPIADRCDQPASRIALRYIGGDCDQSFNVQESDKFDCSDFTAGNTHTGPVYIRITERENDSVVFFAGEVNVGDELNMVAPGGGAIAEDSTVRVWTNEAGFLANDRATSLIQELNFQTACAQNLLLKDKYGNVQVVGFEYAATGEVFTCFVPVQFDVDVSSLLPAGINPIRVQQLTAYFDFGTGVETTNLLPSLPLGPILQPGQTKSLSFGRTVDMTSRLSYQTSVDVIAATTDGRNCGATDSVTFVAGNTNSTLSPVTSAPTPVLTSAPEVPSCDILLRPILCFDDETDVPCDLRPPTPDACIARIRFEYVIFNPQPSGQAILITGWSRTRNGNVLDFFPQLPPDPILNGQLEARLFETIDLDTCDPDAYATESIVEALPSPSEPTDVPCSDSSAYVLPPPPCDIRTLVRCLAPDGGLCSEYVAPKIACQVPIDTVKFRFTGELCDDGSNSQPGSCVDIGSAPTVPMPAARLVAVSAATGQELIPDTLVAVGGEIDVPVTGAGTVLISVSDATTSESYQSLIIDTACDPAVPSTTVALADHFGALRVQTFRGAGQWNPHLQVFAYQYNVTNAGSEDVTLTSYESARHGSEVVDMLPELGDGVLPAYEGGSQDVARTEVVVDIANREDYALWWEATGTYEVTGGGVGSCSASGGANVTLGLA